MSESVVLGFLALSLIAYVICGGADFGVGILEFFTPKYRRESMRMTGEHAIAPVWEANHVWLIIVIVIIFVGFPTVHVKLATHLHVPILLMLAGIIIRGTAFTFRYYDIGDDRPAEQVWSVLFRTGSILVPLMFGHLAASLSRGAMPTTDAGFFARYLAPWLGWFPLALGVFTVTLFAWIAAVFLAGENAAAECSSDERSDGIVRAKRCSILVVVTNALVAIAAWLEQVPWFMHALERPLGYACGAIAVACGAGLWRCLETRALWWSRVAVGVIVTCVLGGYWGLSYPIALTLGGGSLTWHEAAAGSATLDALAVTLSAGLVLILPALGWLYRLFKSEKPQKAEHG